MSKIRSKAGLAKRKRQTKWGMYFSATFFILIIIGLGYYLWSGKYNIENLTIQGIGITSEISIRNIVEQESNKKIWKVFPRNNWLLYPREEILSRLEKELPSLEQIRVHVRFRNVTMIVIERVPLYTWCGDSIGGATASNCYFVDKKGIIFAPAPYFEGNTYIKLYKAMPIAPGGSFLGNILVTEETLTSLENFLKQLTVIGQAVEEVEFNKVGEVTMRTDKDLNILAKISPDYSKLIETIDTVLKERALKATSTISTIDARISNKLFLQYR